MENKNYKVKLLKKEENDVLLFTLSPETYIIDLNSEDQTNLRKLFYKIIEICFKEMPVFELEIEGDYNDSIFKEIAEEYIKDLNKEIEKIIEKLPDFSK